MSENVLNILINAGTSLLSSIVTATITYLISKKNQERTFKNQLTTYKIKVFEQFICSYDDIYITIYQRTPITVITSINNVLLYLNANKQAPFIKLRNNLTTATEQDIPELIQQFNICVDILNEEIKSLNKVR